MLFRGIVAVAIALACVGLSIGTLFDSIDLATIDRGFGESSGVAGTDGSTPTPVSFVHSAAAALRIHGPVEPDESVSSYRHTLRVERGDTLGGMLARVGVSGPEANAAFTALKEHFDVRKMRVGQDIELTLAPPVGVGDTGQLLALTIASSPIEEVTVARGLEGDYVASKHRIATDTAPTRASGVIENSLFVAGEKSGVPAPVLVELIRAYSWDVDFQRDIQPGDGFEIMYERFVDSGGNTVHHGNIAYAALTLSGKKRLSTDSPATMVKMAFSTKAARARERRCCEHRSTAPGCRRALASAGIRFSDTPRCTAASILPPPQGPRSTPPVAAPSMSPAAMGDMASTFVSATTAATPPPTPT